MPSLIAVAVAVLLVAFAIQYLLFKKQANGSDKQNGSVNGRLYANELTPMPADFDWREQDPEKYRPMRDAVYKMTMGIKNLDFNDYILVDKNFVDRTDVRINLVKDLPDETILYNDIAKEAVLEYYEFVLDYYLRRYPMIFKKVGNRIHNTARDEYIPASSSGQDPVEILHLMARHMEDDFLILIKDEGYGEYVLRAASSVFPNGFSPSYNLNRPLTSIHTPVPQYESKMKLAMNRFFDRVQPYQFVYRVNWGIQTHTNLFALSGNHGKPQAFENVAKLDATKLDFNKIFLRSERQVLTRLPKSRAAVFSLKTYCTPLTKIRDEGHADVLVGAIEKLPEDIAVYKNRPKWGDAVIAYMHGDTNGITDERYDYKFTT